MRRLLKFVAIFSLAALVTGSPALSGGSRPEGRSGVTPQDATPAIAALDGRGGGIIAFNSDRDGNSEIYLMNADGSGQRNITNNPSNDGFGVWSPDGARIAFVSDRDGRFGVYVMSVTNLEDAQFGPPLKVADKRPSSRISWSPDGSTIMFDAWPECDIFVVGADGANLKQLTATPDCESQPQYSPDGSKISFSTTQNDRQDIHTMNADGTHRLQITKDGVSYFPTWSPDGGTIAFNSTRPGRQDVDICLINPDGAKRRWLTDYPNLDEFPTWSPDGRQIAYESRRGVRTIFVMNADGSQNHQISGDDGHSDGEPNWRPTRFSTHHEAKTPNS